MVFKLVRTDTEEPCKIRLPLGTHMIGRGKFLECDDKRVSRNHGELQVTDDSIVIKALHQNPCFYIKKGTEETIILKNNCTADLGNGDKFGLLPGSHWYEVLHCTSLDTLRQSPETKDSQETVVQDSTVVNENNTQNALGDHEMDENAGKPESVSLVQRTESPSLVQRAESPSLVQRSESPSLIQRPESPSLVQGSESPSLIRRPESPSFTQKAESPRGSLLPPVPNECPAQNNQDNDTSNQTEEPKSPSKRPHSPQENDDAKRVKTEPADVKLEPDDVKQEPDVKPGPSNDQAGSSTADKDGQPASPVKPLGRERCIYGANCYRKNPQHKAQFSHPSDSDWGAGPRGVCPWGRGCQKRDARHWRDHEHPPGVERAPDRRPGMQVVERNGNIFYINAHTVNFHDDHFQVEDSDGDSVDYDYEF